MVAQMRFDLLFSLGYKPEAGAVAQRAGKRADRERADIPCRIQNAWPTVELFQAQLAPSQMIHFLLCRLPHGFFDLGIAGGEGLSLIKSLRSHLSGVVYTHQPQRFEPLRLRQVGPGVVARRFPRGPWWQR